jgi:predicted ArsR family transcriptional regulator
MRSALDDGDRSFLGELHRLRTANVHELCGALGVTATAVRQRLVRLQGLRLIERTVVRTGRGRPHHTYVLTDAGHRELGDNFAELALLLWDELRQIEEPAVRERVLDRMQERLVQRYGAPVQGRTVPQRMEQLRGSLVERGFHVETDRQGDLSVLRERHCPYHELAAADSTVCTMEKGIFERILGVPLVLAQCCRNGDACCEFHAAAPNA